MTAARDLTSRRALVTGAGQRLGRGIALALAAAGAHVVVNDIDSARADAVVDEIRPTGAEASAAVFDVTDFAAVTRAVDADQPVDILVNNAGNAGADSTFALTPFAKTGPADWEPFVRINLYGVLHCTRAVLPGMIEREWGRIITIVSDAGRVGGSHTAVYGAAKAAAAGLTRSIALENGRYGITANNISLGTMRPSQMSAAEIAESPRLTRVLDRYAIRRPGAPEDVAPLVVLLASHQASWITGQTYPVNGGYSFAL